MPTPADVAVQDAIRAILRDHPIYMTTLELATRLYAETGRTLTGYETWRHCQHLYIGGYLHKHWTAPTSWAFIPAAMASQHRRVELQEAREFEALAELAGEKGTTR